jgi:tetratricopeptide (TPR) repeat protein
LCNRHAEVSKVSEALSAAVRWLNRGFRCLDDISGPEATAWRARMRSNLGGIRSRQGRWSEAVAACRQAIAEAESVGELSALAHACYALDAALVRSGRADEATNSARALDIYEQLGDPEHEFLVLNNLGGFAYFDGRWDEAISLYLRGSACAQRAGRPADGAFADCNVGEILCDQGQLDQAQDHLQRARRIWSATGERGAVAYVDVLLARVAVRQARYEHGIATLETSMAELRRVGLGPYADFAEASIAEAEALGGDPSRALAIADEKTDSGDTYRLLLQRVYGMALARLGQRDLAEGALIRALESARQRGAKYDVAATIHVLAALGCADAALVRERNEIIERLKIERLPVPALP